MKCNDISTGDYKGLVMQGKVKLMFQLPDVGAGKVMRVYLYTHSEEGQLPCVLSFWSAKEGAPVTTEAPLETFHAYYREYVAFVRDARANSKRTAERYCMAEEARLGSDGWEREVYKVMSEAYVFALADCRVVVGG